MYLNQLSNEQKELFLDLCIHAAQANHVVEEKEKQYIEQYCTEMQLESVRFTVRISVEEAVEKLVAISTMRELRIVLIELTALVLCDGTYDEAEKAFVQQLACAANVAESEMLQIQENVSDLFTIYAKLDKLIG